MSDTVLERWIEWCSDPYRAVVCFSNTDTERDVVADSEHTGRFAIYRTQRWALDHDLGQLEVRRV